MNELTSQTLDPELIKHWRSYIAPYTRSDTRRSLWQIVNSVIPFLLLWGIMAWSVQISYWLTLLLVIPTAGFMVRIFIIFHDCGHGSFFKSQRANAITGFITGVMTLTPFDFWTRDHAIHHATAGNLDKRGVGDVPTLTVKEYLMLPRWRKLIYRLTRNPIGMFLVGAPIVFLVAHRFSRKGVSKRELYSVIWHDFALVAVILLLGLTVGWKTLLLVELPVIFIGTIVGVWMFYVQHQFEGVYWRRTNEWNYLESAMKGASYYKLPKVLQWFTGNIGFHHIHHLAPRIPNYNLEKCLAYNPALQCVTTLTLRTSLHSLRLRLYDEDKRRLIGYRELKELQEKAVTV